MKNILIVGLTVAGLSALPVQAQTTQQGVVGASGVPGFPVSVRGSDGSLYSCRDEITQTADGRPKRECIPAGDDGTVFSAGNGFEVSPAAGAIAIAVVALIAGGGSSTTTTAATSSGGGLAATSDQRLKSDITRVGTTSHGLPLYHFRYTGGTQLFEGVMAQDVQTVMPEAVVTMDNGYFGVRYDMLGLEMRAVH